MLREDAMEAFTPAVQQTQDKWKSLTESHPEIFRASSTQVLLAWFGMVFSHTNQFGDFAVFDGHTPEVVTSEDFAATELTTMADAEYEKSQSCQRFDAFVSHPWAAGRMAKHMALLFHMNIRLAVGSSVFTWVAGNIGFLATVGFDVTALGGEPMLGPVLIFLPTIVFLLVFWFGQQLTCHVFKLSVWVDKLCIHQTREDLKSLGVQNLDVFVAAADRMILLWNESFFSRLWCNLEVATFCALNGGADRIDFCPLWLAPWVLNTIMLDIVSSVIFVIMLPTSQKISDSLGPDLGLFVRVVVNLVVTYLPAIVPNCISFRAKIRATTMMMQQIENYRLEEAKCAVESDRAVVETQVSTFFSNAELQFKQRRSISEKDNSAVPEDRAALVQPDSERAGGRSNRQDGVDNFNAFMRTDFRRHMEARVGSATRLPYWISLVVFLPLIFSSSVDALGCENRDCTEAAALMGVESPHLFVSVVALNCIQLIHYCMQEVRDGPLQFINCCAAVVLGYFHMGVVEGAVVTLNSMILKDSAWWAPVAWLGVMAYLSALNYHLFLAKDPLPLRPSQHAAPVPLADGAKAKGVALALLA
ncbi:unnamed protein product, partial [Prorocentrum cordatum]